MLLDLPESEIVSALGQDHPLAQGILTGRYTPDLATCLRNYAADEDDPYVEWARNNLADDDLEIDDYVPTAEADDGTWVLAWVWVPKCEVLEDVD